LPLATGDNGFTLIELAIVLVIMGLLIGMGAGLVGPLTKRAKVFETKEIMNAAVESVVSFGASSNSLPDAAEFPSTVRNPNDTWTKPLNYIFDSNLTVGICGRRSTNITVNICPDAGCSSPQAINDVAFIILSSGENYNNQTAGPQAVAAAATINVYTQGTDIDNYATDMSRTEPYDDIVKWITLGELTIKADCNSSRLKILNNELLVGQKGVPYSTDIYPNGGVPFTGGNYKWCRQENISSGLTFSPVTLSGNCLTLAESSWSPANSTLNISGQPSISGTVMYTFFVRDDSDSSGPNDNIVQKSLVMTISP
jgi:prepilin-type N-terminal cleavage/methylation domain-containing protein